MELLGEPAYDLWNPRENGEELATILWKSHWDSLAHNETGVEKQSIWEWAFIQSVSTGLFLKVIQEHGLGDSLRTLRMVALEQSQFQ